MSEDSKLRTPQRLEMSQNDWNVTEWYVFPDSCSDQGFHFTSASEIPIYDQ